MGDLTVAAFTSPAPPTVGHVEVSILIQDARSGRPVLDVPAEVWARPGDTEAWRFKIAATDEAATNKLLRCALLPIASTGRWEFRVIVRDQSLDFALEVGDAPSAWSEMAFWIAWPLAVVGLFGVHQGLVARAGRFGSRSKGTC